jgi:uncharacterized phiE125 gp8 family phage protein
MGLQLIAPPVEEPVDILDLKSDLRVTHTDDDVQLARLNAEAREWIESKTEWQLALKTWELTIDYFPAAEILLPLRPVGGIVSIKYDNSEGFEQTLPPGDYYLDNAGEFGWVFPATSWPATLEAVNAVRVEFTAGYTDTELVPRALKSAITLQVAELYDGPDETRKARIRDFMEPYMLVLA